MDILMLPGDGIGPEITEATKRVLMEVDDALALGLTLESSDNAMAQAQHGSAPDIAGKGIANPTSLLLSAAMLLDWRARRDGSDDLTRAAALVQHAVEATLHDPKTRPPDLGGDLRTSDFTDAVLAHLRRAVHPQPGAE